MADLRKCIPAFAVVALLLGMLSTASAQVTPPALSCVANAAVPTNVRAEGLTELVGDLILNCTGGTPTPNGQPIPQVNVQIFLNTAITSRILTSPWAEALLTLDEPTAPSGTSAGTQFPCQTPPPGFAIGVCPAVGNGVGGAPTLPTYYGPGTPGTANNNKNVYQGQIQGSNSVLFLGIPIDPPGTTGVRIIRVTNVRANANLLGVSAANAPPIAITETITASGSTSLPINNPTQTVAAVTKGLSFTIRNTVGDALTSPTGFAQCVSQNTSTPVVQNIGRVRFEELFATAFKIRVGTDAAGNLTPQNVPGTIYNTESGFYSPNLVGDTANRGALNTAGIADFGTRLKAVFNGVPAGVTLYADRVSGPAGIGNGLGTGSNIAVSVTSETGSLSLVGASSDPTNTINAGATGIFQLNTSGGSGQAVWEVIGADPFAIGRVEFNIYARFTASPGTNSPSLGTSSVNGSYAPTPPAFVLADGSKAQTSSFPIPRFADTSTSSNLFAISACVTNLLFPFVTNQAGFDTGIAYSNTSQDPFGTSTQAGTCSTNYYGANAPAAQTSPSVAGGSSYVFLISSQAPNFQGYMIAQCRFQYAHGFAFVSDLGARNLAMGYLALVIPDRGAGARTADPNNLAGATSGEQLGN